MTDMKWRMTEPLPADRPWPPVDVEAARLKELEAVEKTKATHLALQEAHEHRNGDG